MPARHLVLLTVLAASTAGMARTYEFGVQGGLAFPVGTMTHNMRNDAVPAIGGQLRIDMGNGHAFVPRIDISTFSGSDDSWTPRAKVRNDLYAFAIDWNYYLSRQVGQGFYVGGGLGYLRKEDRYTLPAASYTVGDHTSESKDRLTMALVLGVAINRRWSVFARIQGFFDNENKSKSNTNPPDQIGSSSDFSAPVTCGVEYHF